MVKHECVLVVNQEGGGGGSIKRVCSKMRGGGEW